VSLRHASQKGLRNTGPSTCFFSVRRQDKMSRVARDSASARALCRVPASARRPPPCPVPSPPAARRWLRASCSTLALAWLASRIGRLPLLLAQAWRGATLWASRRWALSFAGSLPASSRLGGANERSRSSRRGRGWSSPSGCVVAAFHRWLPSQRSAVVLRARAAPVAGRGQHDLLVMAGESRAAWWSAGGSRKARSGRHIFFARLL